MSEWSTSLGYSAGDFFPGSDDEADVVEGQFQQPPASTVVNEEQVNFVDTPFTIAARNAQLRKARGPLEPDVGGSFTSKLERRQAPPGLPVQDDEDLLDFDAIPDVDFLNASVETPAPLAPRHDIRHPILQARTPSAPSEVIVVSSDTDDERPYSTKAMHGSLDTETQPRRAGLSQPSAKTPGKRALQLLLDRDHEFYESLERDLAQQEAHRYASEAPSSSARMESMIPDASTSYDTSSLAPTRTHYSHEIYPVAHLQPAPSPSMHSHQAYYVPPRVPTPIDTSLVYDAYGNPMQPVYLAPPPAQTNNAYPAYMLAPAMPEGSGYVHPNAQPPYRSDHGPDSRYFPQPQHQPMYQPAYYTQQHWHGSVSPVPIAQQQQQVGHERTSLAAYARPKSPCQAREDKAKADLVYKALQGASKRARARNKSAAGPSSASKGKGKESEWSTLKALRTGPGGGLSLTATLRRPLPATKLAHGIRGGSRLALPLYRNPGSSPEERRRAENVLSQDSLRQNHAESSSSSRPSRTVEPSHAPKLFRPAPLTETEQNRHKG